MNNDASLRAGHRARLREKFTQHKIVDFEVFELLLTYAIPRLDVKPIARRLMARYGTIHGVLTASREGLAEVKGVGCKSAIFIKAIYEIMIQDYRHYLNEKSVTMDYEVLRKYCQLVLSGKPVEEFHVLYFDRINRLIVDDIHSSGTSDATLVNPREILKRALNVTAAQVILVHNHPDGSAFFSIKDIQLTMEVKRVLTIARISMFDHLLVFRDQVISAVKLNLLREFSTAPAAPQPGFQSYQ